MNCYYHPSAAAVGICKSCGKGLCSVCAVDLDRGLACRDHCERDVSDLIDLVQRNIKQSTVNEHIIKSARGSRYNIAWFLLVFGLLVLGLAGYGYVQSGMRQIDPVQIGMGLCFFIFGLVMMRRAISFPKVPK